MMVIMFFHPCPHLVFGHVFCMLHSSDHQQNRLVITDSSLQCMPCDAIEYSAQPGLSNIGQDGFTAT
jgi:hypothetical protein